MKQGYNVRVKIPVEMIQQLAEKSATCIRQHKDPVPSTATVYTFGIIPYRICTRCANELETMGLSIVRIVYDVVNPTHK